MRKLVFTVCALMLSLIISAPKEVYAAEVSDYTEMITTYYNYINTNRSYKVTELYGKGLNEFCADFFEDEQNISEHAGIYNVKSVEVVFAELVSSKEQHNDTIELFSDIETYLIKCRMDVYSSDKYYQQGINYFLFDIGKDQDDAMKIIDIRIPDYCTMMQYDELTEEVEYYQSVRNGFLYGQSSGANTYGADSPVYIDYVRNPLTIRVQGYEDPIDFMEYCTDVAACEINTLTSTAAARASAVAIKMFAMQHVLNAASGADYDIKANQVSYEPGAEISPIADSAIAYAENYFLLGPYGECFKTFFRTEYEAGTGVASYCRQYGGVLAHWGANDLGNSGMTWQNILEYYYTRVSSVTYYNSLMNVGDLIITTTHTHDWSNASYCPTCGALVYL